MSWDKHKTYTNYIKHRKDEFNKAIEERTQDWRALKRERDEALDERDVFKRTLDKRDNELTAARAEVERLHDGTAYCTAYLLSERENERLRKAIEDAPHAQKCRAFVPRYYGWCDCWKREALSDDH